MWLCWNCIATWHRIGRLVHVWYIWVALDWIPCLHWITCLLIMILSSWNLIQLIWHSRSCFIQWWCNWSLVDWCLNWSLVLLIWQWYISCAKKLLLKSKWTRRCTSILRYSRIPRRLLTIHWRQMIGPSRHLNICLIHFNFSNQNM